MRLIDADALFEKVQCISDNQDQADKVAMVLEEITNAPNVDILDLTCTLCSAAGYSFTEQEIVEAITESIDSEYESNIWYAKRPYYKWNPEDNTIERVEQ